MSGSGQHWPYDASDAHGWPALEDCTDEAGTFKKALCEAKLEVRKKRTDQQIARAKAEIDTDLAVEEEYYKGVIEVAKGSIERSRSAAEMVQKAAAAIGTIYTGVLGLSFAAAEAPLPGRALFPAVFLGLTIALSTAFLALLPDPGAQRRTRHHDDTRPDAPAPERLTNQFVHWTRHAAARRAPFLRASVVALAASVLLLPAPFVTVGGDGATAEAAQQGWPEPDPVAGNNVELQKIVYQAQVDEVAAQRKKPIGATTDDAEWPWWLISGVMLCAMLAVARAPVSQEEWDARRRRSRAPSSSVNA